MVAATFREACPDARLLQRVLRSILQVLKPGEPLDVVGVRDASRSPRAKAMPRASQVTSKAMPQVSHAKSKAAPQPSPLPPSPADDVNDVPEVHWRAESVVEGEESQIPWRPFLAGDWRCTRCGNHNMHWRGYCFGQHGRCRNPRDVDFRPGDWYCQCGNYNLHWRAHCNRGKCGRSRADGGEQQPPRL